jgi:large subunit ribosomal protein L13
MKTYSPKAKEITRQWHVIDAAGVPLGRLASQVAQLLRGKHKPTFAPHMDGGDHVIVVNAEQVVLTGNKLDQKFYYRHSGYPGGFRAIRARDEMARRPVRVIERAVKGMLPHTALGKAQLGKLRVYPGPDHPHAGQVNPGPGKVKTRRPRTEAADGAATAAATASDAPEAAATATPVATADAPATVPTSPSEVAQVEAASDGGAQASEARADEARADEAQADEAQGGAQARGNTEEAKS